ncbi:MAG TPA: alpha-hydroxy acid oxidase [Candidatus Dormibacteraeota bacterium]|nr:alpha-hydroxy acid oxidase [Candidatus Dormibacteraeota bacterium]
MPEVSPLAALADCVNVDELEERARALLPPATYGYYVGGAEDEVSVRDNRAAFGRWRFRHRVLAEVGEPDLGVTVLGQSLRLPLLLSPTAAQVLASPEGEVATARAALSAGTLFSLSTFSTRSLEDVAAVGGPRWFQLYVYRDRGLTGELIDRAEAAGYGAILFTVDTPILGRREREERLGFGLPEGVTYANLAGRPGNRAEITAAGASGLAQYVATELDATLGWKDLEWLAGRTRLPVLLKGVVRGDDARRCLAGGAAGIVVSNHGGRQLDYSIPTLDALPEVVEAVAGAAPVLLDGGVRRGTDVLKALCLGAAAVMFGRPYLWALAVGGEAGVELLLARMRAEIATSMALLGARRVADLTPDLLVRAAGG